MLSFGCQALLQGTYGQAEEPEYPDHDGSYPAEGEEGAEYYDYEGEEGQDGGVDAWRGAARRYAGAGLLPSADIRLRT